MSTSKFHIFLCVIRDIFIRFVDNSYISNFFSSLAVSEKISISPKLRIYPFRNWFHEWNTFTRRRTRVRSSSCLNFLEKKKSYSCFKKLVDSLSKQLSSMSTREWWLSLKRRERERRKRVSLLYLWLMGELSWTPLWSNAPSERQQESSWSLLNRQPQSVSSTRDRSIND